LQALRLVDSVIANGQSMLVFLEFSALVLPNVMIFVLPLSTFAATLYTANRMYVESEMVVMLMAGQSPWALARPMLIFSAGIAVATAIVSLYLYPVSARMLLDRQFEMRAELTNSMIQAGRFRHPVAGVTVFIENTSEKGEMAGIFLHDARDEEQAVTYSANRAIMVKDGDEGRIVMFDGIAQRMNVADGTFSNVKFTRSAFDITEFYSEQQRRRRPSAREFFFHEGAAPTEAMLKRRPLGRFVSEAHDKLVIPLMTLVLPLIAVGAVLRGSFRRGGFGLRISLGVGLLVAMQLLMMLTKSAVKDTPGIWPLSYLPVIVALAIGVGLISMASSRRGMGA